MLAINNLNERNFAPIFFRIGIYLYTGIVGAYK